MARVLDYSAGYPGALAITRAGYAGAIRYIGFPSRRKCTNRAEYEDFSRHGLSMALVYQDGTGDWEGGYAAGQASAQRARNHADDIGFPHGRPIYFAIDRDVVTARDFDRVAAYLNGAVSVLGIRNVGVYGEHDVVRFALAREVATYAWQTAAWSKGKRFPGAHIFQKVGYEYVLGIACDVNEVLAPDWGQHNYAQPPAPKPKEDDDVSHKNRKLIKLADRPEIWLSDGNRQTRRWVQSMAGEDGQPKTLEKIQWLMRQDGCPEHNVLVGVQVGDEWFGIVDDLDAYGTPIGPVPSETERD